MMTVITTALVVCITELDRFYFISKTLFVSNQIKKYFYSSSNIRLPLLNYLRIDDDDISSLQIEIVCRLQPQNYVCRKTWFHSVSLSWYSGSPMIGECVEQENWIERVNVMDIERVFLGLKDTEIWDSRKCIISTHNGNHKYS